MVDITLEIVRTLVLLGIVILLSLAGKNRFEQSRKGWTLIVGGFGLLFFGSLIDITDNFENLNRFVVIGDTETEAILENFIGFLGGFVVLAIGLIQWLPSVQRLSDDTAERERAEATLLTAHGTLEYGVQERTGDLEKEYARRKRLETLLVANASQLEVILDNLDQGVSLIDGDLKVVAFNQRFLELLEFPSESFRPGDNFEKFIRYNAERGEYGQGDVEAQVRERVALAKRFEPHCFERVRPDGVAIEIRGKPIPGSVGFVTTYTDTTLRRQAEEALQASEARLAGILDIALEAVISVDQDQRIRMFNQGATAIFGYAADEALGCPLDMFLPARFKDVHGKHVEGFARSSEITLKMGERGEVVGLRKDGSEFPAEASVSKLQQGGETLFTVMLRDVSERKSVEEAMRDAKQQAELANRAKSEFLANMSHELRTPLNAIIGFSDMIRAETFGSVGNPKYLEYVKYINQSGMHLLDLINDILDLSKIEAGKFVSHEEAVDVAKAVRSCLRLVKARAETAGVNLKSEIADGLPRLYADARKLKQILINLLSNATKFTLAGGTVTLRAWSRPVDGFVFQVADTGIGIALEDIPKALAAFQQIDGDLNRKYEGTGLGLPLTKSLVELHGGSLDLQSEVGVGTTVTVRFPAGRVVASLDNSDSLDVEDRAVS